MADKWIVLKFGGTSVAGRLQWERIASLAGERRAAGFRVLLVSSAVVGVTNRLSALADEPGAADGFEELLRTHRELSRELEVDEGAWLPEARQNLRHCLEALQAKPGPKSRAALLAMGEWLSTRIGFLFLQASLDVDWVDARDALEIVRETDLSPARRWLSAACAPGADPDLVARWAVLNPVLQTQGFVARAEDGCTALL